MPEFRRSCRRPHAEWFTARRLLCAALVAALAGLPAAARAAPCEALAGATLRWIVPNSPGGGYDAYSRLIQPFLEQELRATILIENRPEAGGLVGAAAIRDAAHDGRTLGIINASGLLAASMDGRTPNPATDFTILARILTNHTVVLTGRDSGITNLRVLQEVAARRPVVIGVRDAGSASIFLVPVLAALLDMDYELVTGYVGNTARALAAIRGEVDLLVQTFDSTRRFITAGELRPLLQVTGAAAVAGPGPKLDLLAGVPILGGDDGVAVQQAQRAGRPPEQARRQAQALAALIDAGRLVVAPRSLPEGPRRCLETAIGAVLNSPELRSAATRAQLAIEPADAATARADVVTAARSLAEFRPLVEAAMRRARQ
jgi:tripartite-type tricarboxylate transporter receptor subunit TctC